MPTITRWFRVTHDINQDPEIWELRELHGDRAGFVWLECLSIADRNSGVVGPASDHTRNQLASKCRTNRVKVGLVLDWCRVKGWLVFDSHIRVAKWRKYNKVRDVAESPSETTPRLSRHDETKKIKSIAPNQNFPDEWKWLESWVKKQNSGFPIDRFLDWPWWDAVSETCGGLSEDWLESQSAAWRRWIMDNPARSPTPRGYRKFVAGWLERSYDKERRYGKTKS